MIMRLLLAGIVICCMDCHAGIDDFSRDASWAGPSVGSVRDAALAWLATRTADEPAGSAVLERGRAAWEARQSAVEFDLLDAVMETLALGDPRIAEVRASGGRMASATAADATSPAPDEPWLDDPAAATFEREVVRLWLGRQLVRSERFDEALPLLSGLDLSTAVDPAALLFHRAVCLHWMLETEEAINTLDRLLERPEDIPVRYERLARLLRADIAALEDDSLDHVARRMRDVRRRLGFGRTGGGTRRIQDGVITSLDRMIKDLEDQQEQQQPSAAGGGGGGEGQGGAAAPLDESRLAGGRGPGEVKSRDLGTGDGWGNLPPHAREESLQQIGREFPPHYREAIEQYFKRLATGGEAR